MRFSGRVPQQEGFRKQKKEGEAGIAKNAIALELYLQKLIQRRGQKIYILPTRDELTTNLVGRVAGTILAFRCPSHPPHLPLVVHETVKQKKDSCKPQHLKPLPPILHKTLFLMPSSFTLYHHL